jgi:hypothetical protein
VTEEGVAYLYKTEGLDERKAAIEAIAGATETGLRGQIKGEPPICAPAASWQLPRISKSVASRRAGRCWRHAVSTTSWPRPAVSRPPSSAAGGTVMSHIAVLSPVEAVLVQRTASLPVSSVPGTWRSLRAPRSFSVEPHCSSRSLSAAAETAV